MNHFTSDDITRMIVEIETGKQPLLTAPEANALREQLRIECTAIKARGGTIDVPHEVPDL